MKRIITKAFFQDRLLSVLFTSGALSDLVLIDTVVQYWLLAIDCDCISIGLSFESPPVLCNLRIITIIYIY